MTMANWIKTVDIKEVLRNEDLAPVGKAAGLVAKLRTLPPGLPNDPDMAEIFDELKDLSGNTLTDDDDLDCVLERLYDWADYNRVWLGS